MKSLKSPRETMTTATVAAEEVAIGTENVMMIGVAAEEVLLVVVKRVVVVKAVEGDVRNVKMKKLMMKQVT